MSGAHLQKMLPDSNVFDHLRMECTLSDFCWRKNYCRAESGFLMRPRVRVGFGLTSSGSGRVRAEPTRPDSIFGFACQRNELACQVRHACQGLPIPVIG